jgi:hypothetical protein
LIGINADKVTRERYVDNIVVKWAEADTDQERRGLNWYRSAHELALMLTDGNARMGAGVIAALSANKSWQENTRLATLAFTEGKLSGHFADALHKAARIMSGEDPADVLPMHCKTGHFFRCIADPTDAEAICIDRHAHDIAVGERYGNRDRGLGAKGRYALIADCYREAARRIGRIPQVVQAVTWVVQIDTRS